MIAGPSRQRSIAFFYVSTMMFWASMYLYLPILSVHAENLGASMGLVGTIVGAYGFTQFLVRVPMGVLSDRIGAAKPFIAVGLVAAALGALGLALSSDPVWLVAWRGLSGVGAAAWVEFTILFSSYYPPHKITRAMSYATFVSGLAQVVASFAGGVAAQEWGWTAPFWGAAAMGLLALIPAMGMTEKPEAVRRKSTPADLIHIATVPLLLVVSITAMLGSWTQWAGANGFSLVYAARLGAGSADLAMLTNVMQISFTAATLASSFVADRFGLRRGAAIGMALLGISALIVPAVHSLPLIALSQGLSGAGRGLSYPILMSLSIKTIRSADRATAMGVFQAVYAFGMFAGPASTGVIADSFGLVSVFVIAGLASLAGAVLVVARVPSKA